MLAYSVAASVGYVTVAALHAAASDAVSPDVFAGYIFFIMALHIGATGLLSYGLAELHFNPQSLILLPGTLLLAAFVVGLATTLRANFLNSGFALGIALPNALFGLIFSTAVAIGLLATLGFIYSSAARRQRKTYAAEEI